MRRRRDVRPVCRRRVVFSDAGRVGSGDPVGGAVGVDRPAAAHSRPAVGPARLLAVVGDRAHPGGRTPASTASFLVALGNAEVANGDGIGPTVIGVPCALLLPALVVAAVWIPARRACRAGDIRAPRVVVVRAGVPPAFRWTRGYAEQQLRAHLASPRSTPPTSTVVGGLARERAQRISSRSVRRRTARASRRYHRHSPGCRATRTVAPTTARA